MKNIVMFSGGLNSFMLAYLLNQEFGPGETLLLFSDTLIEDEDLYRFLFESSEKLGIPLVVLVEGRSPWEVFKDERYIGNTRADPCSKILKRQLIRAWVDNAFGPDKAMIYIGIDWTEAHRIKRINTSWAPYTVRTPLVEEPFYSKRDILEVLKLMEIEPPRLYQMGFPHNNCGGFCVKAGQGQFKLLKQHFPERYQHHQDQEEALRQHLGKDVAILRDRRGGDTKPLTLAKFAEMMDDNPRQLDLFDLGGCGCFTDD